MLIVGLGNPGDEYKMTRHNIGFMLIDRIASTFNISMKRKFQGMYGIGEILGNKVYLLKPETYMNRSGISVRECADFYKIDVSDIIVAHDDINIPFDSIKLKHNGSSGGHNGIKSMINMLSTQEFKRLKIGVGMEVSAGNVLKAGAVAGIVGKAIHPVLGVIAGGFAIHKAQVSYVLGKFNRYELKSMDDILARSETAIELTLTDGIVKAMNEFN